MTTIGVTGGIGSGKTYVCDILRQLSYPVYDCDAEAKRLMNTDPSIRHDLIALIGPEAYNNGAINKPVIARYLFQSQEHVAQVNAIVHPRVLEDFQNWKHRHSQHEFVFMESAILYESHFDQAVDAVIAVTAPETLRLQRAIQRDHSQAEAIRQRMDKQLPEATLRAKADHIILNDGTTDIHQSIHDALTHFRHQFNI